MAEDVMLQEALDAIRQGQRARARDLLTRLLRTNQNNPEYWLWMSSVVETTKEQVYCLQSALKVDPNNAAAKQGLTLLGARVAEGEVTPVAPVRRKWNVEVQEVHEVSPLRAFFANPVVRITIFAVLGLAAVILIGLGVYAQSAARRPTPVAAYIPTNTPGPTPTFTYTPTAINEVARTATSLPPTLAGPQPLWMKLEATYTPTAVYVRTPHPSNEAFLLAERALQRGDLNTALSNLNQAQQVSPNDADIPFLIGEIYRQNGDSERALDNYEKALRINADFAPAILSRALLLYAANPRTDITKDLDRAIAADPNYAAAYLARADYRLAKGDAQGAWEDLDAAGQLLPDSPLPYLLRAQIQLANGENQAALESALKANELDQTLLDAYRYIAQAAAAVGDTQQAMAALDTFLTYEEGDALAWLIQGQVLLASGQYSETIKALNSAIRLDKNLREAYLVRGLAYIELGDGQKAVNDIFVAQQGNPQAFLPSIHLARALLVAGRIADALGTVNRSEDLAQTDAERAQVYYWRAQILETNGNVPGALRDWKALTSLPEGVVPAEWLELAESRQKATITPQPKLSATPTPKATATATRTLKPTATVKPSRTPAATPTSTAGKTVTPAPTATR